ncbi:hypothetical protein ACB092_05G071700 [Castanea dentata]
MTAKSPKTAPVANQNLTIKWKPPDAGCYKVNFEGATIQDIHCAGLGVVIRDHHAHLVAVLSQKIPLPHLTKTIQRGLHPCCRIFHSHIQEDKKNSVAHALARQASVIATEYVWFDTMPSHHLNVLVYDL